MLLSEIIIPFLLIIPFVLVCMTGNKRILLGHLLIWAVYNLISVLVLLNISKDTAYGAVLVGVLGFVYYIIMYKVHGVWRLNYKDIVASDKEFRYCNMAFIACIALMIAFSCYVVIKIWHEFNAVDAVIYFSVLMFILVVESVVYHINIKSQMKSARNQSSIDKEVLR